MFPLNNRVMMCFYHLSLREKLGLMRCANGIFAFMNIFFLYHLRRLKSQICIPLGMCNAGYMPTKLGISFFVPVGTARPRRRASNDIS